MMAQRPRILRARSLLLKLIERWIDGIYQFSLDKDETTAFVESGQEAVKQS